MSAAIAAVAVAAGGALLSSSAQRKAASRSADAQVQAAEVAAEEQRRQFDKIQELLRPFVEAGQFAAPQMQRLAGLGSPEDQAAAVAEIEQGPIFQALARQGETGILQNAAATGGLRGGNVQGALATFRPELLNQQILQRFGQLGQLSQIGQASAAQQAAAGQNFANQFGAAQSDIGAARAGGFLARGQSDQQLFNSLFGTAGRAIGGSI